MKIIFLNEDMKFEFLMFVESTYPPITIEGNIPWTKQLLKYLMPFNITRTDNLMPHQCHMPTTTTTCCHLPTVCCHMPHHACYTVSWHNK